MNRLVRAFLCGAGMISAVVLESAAAEPAGYAIVSQYQAVFNAPPRKIPSDFAVDAPLLGNGDTLVTLGGDPAKLQFYINKNDLWIMRADMDSRPQPLARLDLDLPDMQGGSYRVEQHLARAITTGRFEKNGTVVSLETGVAATENLLWVKLSLTGGGIAGRAGLHLPGSGGVTMARPSDNGRDVTADDAAGTRRVGDVQVVERRFEQKVMVPAGAACAVRVVNADEAFTLEPGKAVLIVAAVCSRFDKDDFVAAAVERVAKFQATDLGGVRAAHETWWRVFWSKSFVEIPDKVLEQRYYLSHYVMASASRLYDFPPGLFGWVTTDRPGWNGDYHMNYNHVAPFYGLYAANHVEQADPCHAPILANAHQARALCRKTLGVEGIYQCVGIGPKGSIADANTWMQKSNGSYSCVPLAFRWYATYDLDFARQAYPFVRDVALFWENWLKFENGRYVIYKDAVHEGSGDDFNPLVSLALVRMVMNLALDMSAELDMDADRRVKWEHIRDHISDYPTCTVADLPEKFRPKDKSLWTLPIFRYTEKGTPWWGDNTLGIQHIYPANGLGLDSPPDRLEHSRNQIRVLNRWIDGNGMNSIYAAAARVGYDPNVILTEMRAMLDKLALPNGMIRGNPHGMEHQSIVPNAIQEMLLQSHEGVLCFFPCWPKEQDARFGDLRALGAFLVSAELKEGAVGGVKIRSEKGRACTVQNPWRGGKVRLIRNGQAAEPASGERFTFKTAVRETIELRSDAP